jgi:ketosteroid isomerase-like protein
MPRKNVELLRRAYGEADALTAFVDRCAVDAEIDLTDIYIDQPVLRGIDAIRAYRDARPWGRSQHFEAERYFHLDDKRVLVFVRATATGPVSGAPVALAVAHEFTIRDGLITRMKVYRDRSEALEALGLRE